MATGHKEEEKKGESFTTGGGGRCLSERPKFIDEVFEAIQDGISVLDTDFNIVRVNQWMEKMYAQSIVGKKCYEVYQERDSICPFCPCIKAIKTGETHKSVVPYPSEENPSGWIELSGFPLRDDMGVVVGVIEYVKDITESVKANQETERVYLELEHMNTELEVINRELEDRVSERTARLEAVNKELNAFAYSVSHDLRSPLRAIDGFSAALEEDYKEGLDETARHYLFRIRQGTESMDQLISGLLQLSRLTRRELKVERVDLSKEAIEVCETLASSHKEYRVQCRIEEGLEAHCDRRTVRALLENLLGNAHKFCSGEEEPTVTFGMVSSEEKGKRGFEGEEESRREQNTEKGDPGQKDGEEEKIFFVRDNGVGFDMRYADKLFTAFGRLHQVSEFPGEGIGLATAQRIVNRHGGRIWAEGEVGVGAVFYFILSPFRRR